MIKCKMERKTFSELPRHCLKKGMDIKHRLSVYFKNYLCLYTQMEYKVKRCNSEALVP